MELIKLRDDDKYEFKKLMQEAFQYGYESVYGVDKEQVLPDKDIDDDLKKKNSFAYEMIDNGEIVGGVIVTINKNNHNYLDFLFVKVGIQSKGIGKKIWEEIEKLYPETKVWGTCTPYFDKRNIHFYVNKLKFKIVKYENEPESEEKRDEMFLDEGGMFEFEKIMK